MRSLNVSNSSNMELPSVGAHCCQENCNALDFLPYVCTCCKTFCLEHFTAHSVDCQIGDNVVSELKKIENFLTCSEEGCHERSIIPLVCQNCSKHFCVKHRHIGECVKKTDDEYKAAREILAIPTNQFNAAKANSDREINKKIENAMKNDNKRKLALKVQLMRLKSKAVGLQSIPPTERVYFNILLPSKSEKAVYVSNVWTIGRTIDYIAEICHLKNNNNKSGELKLRLFKMDKNILSHVMSDSIKNLIDSQVILDGESIIIEYVSDNCVVLN